MSSSHFLVKAVTSFHFHMHWQLTEWKEEMASLENQLRIFTYINNSSSFTKLYCICLYILSFWSSLCTFCIPQNYSYVSLKKITKLLRTDSVILSFIFCTQEKNPTKKCAILSQFKTHVAILKSPPSV